MKNVLEWKLKFTALSTTFFLIGMALIITVNGMVTTNIFHRTFQIRVDSASDFGTGFTIEVDNRQYLVTAKHLLRPGLQSIEIWHDGQWKRLTARVISVEPSNVDISIVCLNQKLSPTHPIQLGIGGTFISEEVFFAGFPYGLTMDGHSLNSSFPLPLVKRGVVSALATGQSGNPNYLDAINNPGFSGGPVFTSKDPANPKIIGVISGYRVDFQQLYMNAGTVPNQYVRGNRSGPVGLNSFPCGDKWQTACC